MGLTILEALQGKEPNGRNSFMKNESLKVIYDLCRKHQGEIEEARVRGTRGHKLMMLAVRHGRSRAIWQRV